MAIEPETGRRAHQWREEVYARAAERDARFETISGHPIEPLYTQDDLPGFDPEREARQPRRVPVHPRHLSLDVPGPALDDAPVRRLRDGRGDQRALPLPARPRPDRALDRLRHADPDGPRLRPRALPGRGRGRGRRRRHGRRHEDAVRRDPARRRHRLDDDQRPGGDPARLLRRRRRGAGGPRGAARRHDPDRHPEGVHRPEGVVLPDRAGDAAGHRHGRVLLDRDAALAPDLDLRLPHPRGRLDGRSRSSRSRSRTASPTSSGRSSGALDVDAFAPRLSFFFNAHIDFFEEIAKYRAARRIWAREMRDTLRRPATRASHDDALPHPDGGRLADRPAAAGQHRPDDDRGARRGARRAPSRCTPTPTTRRSPCRPRRRSGSRFAPSR